MIDSKVDNELLNPNIGRTERPGHRWTGRSLCIRCSIFLLTDKVTALLHMPNINCIAIGFNFGGLELLSLVNKDWSYQCFESIYPVCLCVRVCVCVERERIGVYSCEYIWVCSIWLCVDAVWMWDVCCVDWCVLFCECVAFSELNA